MTINLIQRQSVKQKLWKSLSAIVGVTTIFNLSLVGVLIRPLPASALVDTDYLNPSSNANLNATVTTGANAYTQNDTDAVFDDTANHRYGDFGISVPSGQSVVGIQVKVRAHRVSGLSNKNLNIYLTDNNGSSWGSHQNADGFGSSYSTVTLGSSSDLWGRTAWDSSEISNANFAVRIQNDYSSGTVGVDHVAVKVFYGGYTFDLDSPTPPTASQIFTWTLDGSKPGQNEISHVTVAGCWEKSDIDQPGSSTTAGTLVFNNDGTVKIDSLQDSNLPTTLTLALNRSYPSTGTATATVKAGNATLPGLEANGPNCGPPPVPNPPLGQSCGLDIGLIIDRSGSFDDLNDEITPMRNALVNFVDAFTGTPTQVGVVEFSTSASVLQPFTADLTLVKNQISAEVDQLGSGTTNWEDALQESWGQFDPRLAKPNLIVVATDGSPNTYNTDPGTDFSWTNGLALSRAVTQANAIKSAGTRIVVIGIGQDEDDPDFDSGDPTWNNPKLSAISGPNIAPPASVSASTDVIKTDFDQLGAAMQEFAKALCGGKILVQKQFDTNGDGQADLDGAQANAVLNGWEFDVNGSPSNPAPQTTTNTGALEFSVQNGTYSVVESNLKPNTQFVSAACLNGQQSIGSLDPQTRTISGLTMGTDNTIACTFVNGQTTGSLKITKVVSGGTAQPDDFGFRLVGSGSPYIFPTSGQNDVVFDDLPAATYSIEETGPSGYHQSNTTCTDIQVKAGQPAECTITNTRDTENEFNVTIDKVAPATVNAGSQLTYTLNWSVSGNIMVSNVTITDPLPANTTFVSADQGGAYDAGTNTVTWNLGAKNSGDAGTVSFTVTVATPLTNGTLINNTAAICGLGKIVGDFDGKPSTTKKCDADSTTTTVTAAPLLGLQKAANPTTVPAGQNITWTISWNVTGNAVATGVTITDPRPANTTFVSADNGGIYDATSKVITWNLGTQTPGSSGKVSFVVTVASPIVNGTVITNSVTIDSNETDPIATSAIVTVTSAPKLSLAKSVNVITFVNPGTAITYTVTITNAADATDSARNVVLTDTLPNGFTFAIDGATTKSFALGNLAPGQFATVTYVVNVSGTQTAGTYENLAKAKADNVNELTATAPVEVRVPIVLSAVTPELSIGKSVNKKTAKPGDIVTYTLTIKNVGDGDAHNVIVADTLPKDLSFAHGTGRTMTWNIGTLQPSRSRIINIYVRVESDAAKGDYENVAVLSADDAPSQEARATITVQAPKVLGLATTGAGLLDLLIAALGSILIGLGLIGLRRRHEPIPNITYWQLTEDLVGWTY